MKIYFLILVTLVGVIGCSSSPDKDGGGSVTAINQSSNYGLLATCKGWPFEGGHGEVEFFREMVGADNHIVLVRTNQLTGKYGSINISIGESPNTWDKDKVQVVHRQDFLNISSPIEITIYPGVNVKTKFSSGNKTGEMICDSFIK